MGLLRKAYVPSCKRVHMLQFELFFQNRHINVDTDDGYFGFGLFPSGCGLD